MTGRCLCSDSSVRPTDVDSLTTTRYEEELQRLLSSAKPLDTSNVADCLSGNGLGFYIPDVTGSVDL